MAAIHRYRCASWFYKSSIRESFHALSKPCKLPPCYLLTKKMAAQYLPAPTFTPFLKIRYVMQDIELRFPTLKILIAFKQQSQVNDLRIDTIAKTLTGKFPDEEVLTAKRVFKATIPDQYKVELAARQTAVV